MKSLIMVLTAAACAVLPAYAAAGTLDQQQTSAGTHVVDWVVYTDNPDMLGQTFTPGLSGGLDQIDIYVQRSSPYGPLPPSLVVEIRDASGDLPGSNVLASATVPADQLPSGFGSGIDNPTSVRFTSPATVVAGTRYAFVLRPAKAADFQSYLVFSTYNGGEDVYLGGRQARRVGDGSWTGHDDFDLLFKTYVLKYESSGFLSPIDKTSLNVAKAGKTVPLKWRVTDGNGDPVDDPTHFESVTSVGDTCDSGPSDAIETYAGNSGLQYLGDGYWQFNWQTSRQYAGQCRTLVLTLSDDSTLTADFRFK